MSGEFAQRTYQRHAAMLTDKPVTPPPPPSASRWSGRRRAAAAAAVAEAARPAQADGSEVLDAFDGAVAALRTSLGALAALKRPRLLGKVEEDQRRVDLVIGLLAEARAALEGGDLGACGKAVADAQRQLSSLGGPLAMALATELGQAAVPRKSQAALRANHEAREAAQVAVEKAQGGSPRAATLAAAAAHLVKAEGLGLAAEVLAGQAAPRRRTRAATQGDAEAGLVQPQELETFADVGGLEDAKEHLRRTVGLVLEHSGEAHRSGVVHNGILLYGPPGTGKTLLARAVAGEYGLRFLRFSPALIASAYQHEPAKKLRQVFAQAAESAPCLLFLDEVDAIGGRRDHLASPDQRELATQLLVSLEEHRDVPGLVIMAATNALDHLDPALREGRFDSRIAIPLPDLGARREILAVQLAQRGADPGTVDLDDVAERTSGRSGAALAAIANGAMQRALAEDRPVSHQDLLAEIEGRSGQDRLVQLEEHVGWDDVVLPEATRARLAEILLLFQQPDLGRRLGVRAPAGILLHGPPGTGKTTVAKALAGEVKASFYEQSAADLLSKWVGESEQKVAQLFTRARANRPSIVFIDEIDALLKRRSADSAAPWEERVVSQFLGELDGLNSGDGVLLVGSTNRPDMVDEAVRDRRLVAIEVPLPDADGRRRLLDVLCSSVRLGPDVDLDDVAAATAGMSGADLKAVRDGAGMKALARAAREGAADDAQVGRDDVAAALAERGVELRPSRRRRAPAAGRRPPAPTAGPRTRRPRPGAVPGPDARVNGLDAPP